MISVLQIILKRRATKFLCRYEYIRCFTCETPRYTAFVRLMEPLSVASEDDGTVMEETRGGDDSC